MFEFADFGSFDYQRCQFDLCNFTQCAHMHHMTKSSRKLKAETPHPRGYLHKAFDTKLLSEMLATLHVKNIISQSAGIHIMLISRRTHFQCQVAFFSMLALDVSGINVIW